MKKYIKLLSVFLFLSFLLTASCNHDDDVPPPVDDADAQDPDDTVDTDPDDPADDTPVGTPDYLALKALYEANLNNTLGWNLDDTSMESWDGVILNNDRVTELRINQKNISKLVLEITHLSELTKLFIEDNSVEEIPIEIGDLNKLIWLSLYNNNLDELPEEIGKLINLEELEFTGNPMTVVPQEICDLELTGTNIQKNEFTMHCSGTLIDYNALKILYQQNPNNKLNWGNNNNVDDINMTNWEGVELTAGRVISLILSSDRDLKHLVKEIGDLEKLDYFRAQECGFSKIPKEIGKLKNLTMLYMADNQLDEQSLEEEFFDLENLISLDLGVNNFVDFPSAVDKLSSLTKLYLYSNSLRSVPASIGNMKVLDTIFLQRNALDKIPKEFAELNEATFIDLEVNPLDPLLFPEEVCVLNLALDSDQIADGICQ